MGRCGKSVGCSRETGLTDSRFSCADIEDRILTGHRAKWHGRYRRSRLFSGMRSRLQPCNVGVGGCRAAILPTEKPYGQPYSRKKQQALEQATPYSSTMASLAQASASSRAL